MTSTNPITENRPLAWTTPDGRYTIVVTNTGHSYAITVENGSGFRIDELARTFGDEDQARMFAHDIAKRLRDGATVEQVVAAIQPAADLIAGATALLVLAADVAKLSRPQRDAIRAATNGHITRGQVSTVKTLYALEAAHLGKRTKVGHRTTGLDLNGRGREMQAHILTHMNIHMHTAA